MGVKLVFVMEGEAPKIKAETMSKRTQGRLGGFQKSAAPKSTTNTSRGRFNAVLREVWILAVDLTVRINLCFFLKE